MSLKNLKNKISLLVDDLDGLDRYDQIRTVSDFIKTELNLQERAYAWTERDLSAIKSRAVSIMTDMNSQIKVEGKKLYSNGDLARIYCLVQATYEYMRGQGMSPYLIKLKQDGNSLKTCSHSRAKPDSDGGFTCPECNEKVRPILWVSTKFKDY